MAESLPSIQLDIAANRKAKKYAGHEQLARALWSVGSYLIRFSPRPAFAWRRMVLRTFGARIGKGVNIYPSTRIVMPWNTIIGDWSALGEDVLVYSLGKVSMGKHVTVSYRSHVCAGTHDLNDPALPLLKPATVIEDGVWIGTDAFIGPGVTIGTMAVIGARSVVIKAISSHSIVAGNPARVVGVRHIHS